jgi:DNA-binding LacI/PurR family transcriptional regulator
VGIRELAGHLKLSIATVSRALNDSDEVSADTRRRVVEAAARLGYSPQQAGRSLRQGRSNTVGLMLPAKGPEESYTLSLFFPLAEGAQSVLAPHAVDLVLVQGRSDQSELGQVRRLVERRLVDGLILAGTQRRDPRIDYVADQGFPFVALGRSESGGLHAWVDLDFEAGAGAAVKRLVGFGHRRIAIGVPDDDAMQGHVYFRAWRRALRTHGLAATDELACRGELSERGGYRITQAVLSAPAARRATAILFQSDCMAIGAYRKLAELGLRPGRDLAVSGGVLTGELAEYLSPQLTGFRIALRPLGKRLAEALLRQLAKRPGARREPPVQERWPIELLARPSDEGGPVRRGR